MPALSYSVSDFTAFTKIRSADVNSRFTDIKTLLNTTKLDDDNIQNAGITRATKLKTGTAYAVVVNSSTGAMSEVTPGTAGYFLQSGGAGAAASWVANPILKLFNIILGSAAEVTAGTATHSTWASAISAASAGDRIKVLPGSWTENVSVDKKLLIEGCGPSSVLTGTVTFTSAADYSYLSRIRATDNVTLDSGADGIIVTDIWLASGKSFTDNGSSNYLMAIQE
jgi:hypothetical protein